MGDVTMVYTAAPATEAYTKYGKKMTLSLKNDTTGKQIVAVPMCIEGQPTGLLSSWGMWVSAPWGKLQSGLDCKQTGMTEVYDGTTSGIKYGAYVDISKTIKSLL